MSNFLRLPRSSALSVDVEICDQDQTSRLFALGEVEAGLQDTGTSNLTDDHAIVVILRQRMDRSIGSAVIQAKDQEFMRSCSQHLFVVRSHRLSQHIV